jgi:hypothetical protein
LKINILLLGYRAQAQVYEVQGLMEISFCFLSTDGSAGAVNYFKRTSFPLKTAAQMKT